MLPYLRRELPASLLEQWQQEWDSVERAALETWLALEHLRQQGCVIALDDIARLSPLGYAHINVLGRYHFELAEALQDGSFRSLRDPNDPNEQYY